VNDNRFLLLDLRNVGKWIDDAAVGELAHDLCQTSLVDDLLVLSTSDVADVRYRIFGGDRREADFCCNGALYTLSTLCREGRVGRVTLDTRLGVCAGVVEPRRQTLRLGSVKMESLRPKPWLQPYLEAMHLTVLGIRRAGEPHVIIPAPPYLQGRRFDQQTFEEIGSSLCCGFEIDGGVNVTMTFLTGRDAEPMIRTFERGVRRMTRSCGSGTLAAASILFPDPPDAPTVIHSPGGSHTVWYERQTASWWMSAQAQHDHIQHRPLGKLLEDIRNRLGQHGREPHTRRAHSHHDDARNPPKALLDPYRARRRHTPLPDSR
jgi:diaminopimelate epimerase